MEEKNINWRLLFALIIALIIVGSLWYWNYQGFIDDNGKSNGAFGDKFGVVNSLFSGLAFAGIIITIYMQKHELELQRQELKETRNVFEGQNSLMTTQQNDSTFFNLLENHRQLVDSFKTGSFRHIAGIGINHNGVTETVSGYEVLSKIAKSWQREFENFTISYKSGIIINPKGNFINDKKHTHVKHPLEVINQDVSLINLYKDIHVMLHFIDTNLAAKQKFYKTILWNNISENEKFIFECFVVNRPDLVGELKHNVSVYSKYDYPNFLELSLPDLTFRSFKYAESNAVLVKNRSRVISSRLICYEENDLGFDIISVKKLPKQMFNVYLTDDLSFDGEDHHALSEDRCKLYKNRKYTLEVKVEHDSRKYAYMVGIDSSFVSSNLFDGKYRINQDDIRMINRDLAELLVSAVNSEGE